MTPASAPAIRRAATVLLLRDGAHGIEALMLRRLDSPGDFNAGRYVFPGGVLDAADAQAVPWCDGVDEAEANARLKLDAGALDHYVAAIRECFEEAGVLLAHAPAGRPAPLAALGAGEREALRADLRHGRLGLAAVCQRLDVRLAAGELAYLSHWLTPPGMAKRFDTRFFVAAMPADQEAAVTSEETNAHRWIRPADALRGGDDIELPHPTRRTLEALAHHARVADVLAAARAQREVSCRMPRVAYGPQGRLSIEPEHPAYPEIALVDPDGRGGASYVIAPGEVVRLSPRVRRLTAPNPGLMTGPGTNTYLVRDPAGGACTVIDPGPDDAAHVERILEACEGRVAAVLVTHTHRDHSPAAARLHARTGAPVLGMCARVSEGQDDSFAPQRELVHGEVLALGPDASLQVVHTPGHASNQLCFLLREERLLFTGDHVMQGSTVVITPPDGDMGQYLASLEALRALDLQWLAPGHGFLIPNPPRLLEALLRHRRAREAKVEAVLRRSGPAPLDGLLPQVYDDVPASLHAPARRSLLAHLQHLQAQRRARLHDDHWMATP